MFKKITFLSYKKNKTTIYNYSLLLLVYILITQVNVRSYSDHAVSAQTQQSDIQFYSKGPNNSRQYLPNLANKYLSYGGNFEWNKPLWGPVGNHKNRELG